MHQESRNSGASTLLSAPSYSSENLADIAARVVHELNLSHDDPYDDDFYSSTLNRNDAVETDKDENNADDDESEFEFAVLCGGEEYSSPISADEIFYNGQIKPIYPLFNTDLVFGPQKTTGDEKTATVRVPLRKLMKEERERGNDSVSSSSSSTSSENELEGVPQGTYCVWVPKKKTEEVVTMKTKSHSTGTSSSGGTSKRWRLKDLLHRSISDGKDTFVILTRAHHNKGGEGKSKGGEEKKNKKSYLPYKQDLVGFFANVNGVSRTIRPF